MNSNTFAVFLFCGAFQREAGARPFTAGEWSALEKKLASSKLEPSALLNLWQGKISETLSLSFEETERMFSLLENEKPAEAKLAEYSKNSVGIAAKCDEAFPHKLIERLGNLCPPFLFYSGNLSLANTDAVGIAGSRKIDENDRKFIDLTVKKVVRRGFIVVSGGAAGTDTQGRESSFAHGGACVEYLPEICLKISGQKAAILLRADFFF